MAPDEHYNTDKHKGNEAYRPCFVRLIHDIAQEGHDKGK